MHQVEQLVHQWKEQDEEEFPSQPITNPQCKEECCIIQPSQCVESYNNMLGDIEIKEPSTYDSCTMEAKAPDDPGSSIESTHTKVCVPHILFQWAACNPQSCRNTLKLTGWTVLFKISQNLMIPMIRF